MSNYFQELRLNWIIEIVAIYGYVNRKHVSKKFGISTPQASYDLGEIEKLGLIKYNKNLKRYEKVK